MQPKQNMEAKCDHTLILQASALANIHWRELFKTHQSVPARTPQLAQKSKHDGSAVEVQEIDADL